MTAPPKRPNLRRKKGSKALSEIDAYQNKFLGNLLLYKPCKRLVDSCLHAVNPKLKIRADAVQSLIDALENYAVINFKVWQIMAIHAGRVTIQPEDITNGAQLVSVLSGHEDPDASAVNAKLEKRQKRAFERALEDKEDAKRQKRRDRSEKLKRQKTQSHKHKPKHTTRHDRVHKDKSSDREKKTKKREKEETNKHKKKHRGDTRRSAAEEEDDIFPALASMRRGHKTARSIDPDLLRPVGLADPGSVQQQQQDMIVEDERRDPDDSDRVMDIILNGPPAPAPQKKPVRYKKRPLPPCLADTQFPLRQQNTIRVPLKGLMTELGLSCSSTEVSEDSEEANDSSFNPADYDAETDDDANETGSEAIEDASESSLSRDT